MLSHHSKCISYSVCAPQIGPPLLLAQRIMIALQFQDRAKPALVVFFHVILQAETKLSTVPCKHLQKTCLLCDSLLPSQEHFSLFPLWVLSNTNNNKEEMWCSSKRWGPVNFLYLQQNQRRSLFVSHLGIQSTEHSICLHSHALSKYEQIEGLIWRVSFIWNSQRCKLLLFYLKDLFF